MKTMSQQLAEITLSVGAALANTEILEVLKGCGYPKERLASLLSAADSVQSLNSFHDKEFSEQIAATDELNKKIATANQQYMRIIKLARVAFADDLKAQTALELFGRRKTVNAAWYAQADLFYQSLLNQKDLVNQLAEFGITQLIVENGQKILREVAPALVAQKKETAEAQASTAERDAKMEKLGEDFSKFKKVCRVVFADDIESMKKMGLK